MASGGYDVSHGTNVVGLRARRQGAVRLDPGDHPRRDGGRHRRDPVRQGERVNAPLSSRSSYRVPAKASGTSAGCPSAATRCASSSASSPRSGSASDASPPAAASRARSPTSPSGRCRSGWSAVGSTTSSPTRPATSAPTATRWLRSYVWQGGLGIWGAIALGGVGAWIGCRRMGVKLPPFADALAPGIVLAQAIGRWGNWFNQELYGKPTTLPWGLKIDEAHRVPGYESYETFHPTYLYEFFWDLGTAGLVVWADRRFRLGHGRAFALYVMAYTAGRGWIEALRIDTVEANDVFGLRLTSDLDHPLLPAAYLVVSAPRPPRESASRRPRPRLDLDRALPRRGGVLRGHGPAPSRPRGVGVAGGSRAGRLRDGAGPRAGPRRGLSVRVRRGRQRGPRTRWPSRRRTHRRKAAHAVPPAGQVSLTFDEIGARFG